MAGELGSMSGTRRLGIDPADISEAVDVLTQGGIVAFPTDTVYGVGADARQLQAIDALYEIKRRPLDKAIPLLLANAEELPGVAQRIPKSAWRLAEQFWPGALTMVVWVKQGPNSPLVPPVLTAGKATVAVRVPDHYVVRSLIEGLDAPLAATSANISGSPSPVTGDDVLAQLEGRITLLLDGGPCPGGEPSTVVDLTVTPMRILRHGPITASQIQQAVSPSAQVRKGVSFGGT